METNKNTELRIIFGSEFTDLEKRILACVMQHGTAKANAEAIVFEVAASTFCEECGLLDKEADWKIVKESLLQMMQKMVQITDDDKGTEQCMHLIPKIVISTTKKTIAVSVNYAWLADTQPSFLLCDMKPRQDAGKEEPAETPRTSNNWLEERPEIIYDDFSYIPMAEQKKQICEDAVVEKRTVLNEMHTKMSLQELRLFSVYLSQTNVRNERTRCVRFDLDEFQSIIGCTNKVGVTYMKSVAEKMQTKQVLIPQKNWEYKAIRLFKKCAVEQDKNGTWFVELDCDDDALSLFFDTKHEHFTYKVKYVLSLTSANQFRLYEILKQREKLGEFVISVDALRKLLGFDDEYNSITDFRKKILLPAQEAFSETTDICFSFEPKKRGAKGAWLTIKFKVWSNPAVTS